MSSILGQIKPPLITPETLNLFMSVLVAQSEPEAAALFEQAIRSISGRKRFTGSELQSGYTLFRVINPTDENEQVWCAQFAVSYVLGIHELSRASQKDKRIGQRLMQSAQDAIERINKKRNDTTIRVN